ncbi:uncharacterized protein LOC6538540 [Drosophila yakuba]|uniref:CHK kinase-like domain-containing protein n=1 Tax=Drosophila yakuba TaxID=7245 RepID=B4PU87_DROYA|nr:uncharacterized protein LOC6538540 [Drosophila yakuba]EDW98774.1 uncharacterized protein Dyak_GE23592 [Drosophila yakuba]
MPDSLDTEQFNADELEAPAWLNAQFIADVLRTSEKCPELEVTDLKITPASAQGDHYASIMFRTTAEYTTSKGKFSKPLIIKTMPEQEGHKKDLLSGSHLFDTEVRSYTTALPEFERILREAGDDTKLFVPCIYHSVEPRQVMIFEDLVPQGYSVIRKRPITQTELETVYAKLAKWHAVSMKLLNEQPDLLKDFKYGMMEMPTVLNDPMVTTGMDNFLKMLDQIPELTKYKPHFEKIKGDLIERMGNVMLEHRRNIKPDGYYVMCHGDFHLRNMMFKNDREVMFIDFQACNLCPITVDLKYSLYMLMEPEQRWDLGKDIINYYFSVLEDTLKKVGYKGVMPTNDGLWKQIYRHKFYDFFLLTTFLPLFAAIKANEFKVNEILQDPEVRQKSYLSEIYVRDVKKLLPKYEEVGYFIDL